jgi:hypothetical protein
MLVFHDKLGFGNNKKKFFEKAVNFRYLGKTLKGETFHA